MTGPVVRPMHYCAHCGTALAHGGRFCGSCGAVVVAAPTVPASRAAAAPVEIAGLPVRDLLPFGAWQRSARWWRGQTALFVAIALAPFVLLQATSDDATVESAAVGFAVYFAVLWLLAIRALVRPDPLGWLVPLAVAAFTAVAGVAVAVAVEEQLAATTDSVLSSILTVGLPEELAKTLPILFLLRPGRGRWSPRTYLFVGALSGLAFGAAEAVTYTVAYANVLDLADGGLVVSLWRLLCGSLFHACMAGIVAFFVGLGAWYPSVRWRLVGFGLLVAGVLHGLYDYLSDDWAGTLLAAATVLAFVGYRQSEDRIGGRLAESLASPRRPHQGA